MLKWKCHASTTNPSLTQILIHAICTVSLVRVSGTKTKLLLTRWCATVKVKNQVSKDTLGRLLHVTVKLLGSVAVCDIAILPVKVYKIRK